MEKIQLNVMGLSTSPASNNAYALILREVDGNRRLPIIIGAFEAQAIALALESVKPPRPMTHDLFKSLLDQFDVTMTEVVINDIRDGTFFAKLVFDSVNLEIDARPSDAIAIAVRCNIPIYVNSDVLDETGFTPQADEAQDEQFIQPKHHEEERKKPKTRIENLQSMLDKAIADENYERAAQLRDELNKFLGSS